MQGKKKGFGLDCNRGGTNKTAMKRYPPAAMKRYKDRVVQKGNSGKQYPVEISVGRRKDKKTSLPPVVLRETGGSEAD